MSEIRLDDGDDGEMVQLELISLIPIDRVQHFLECGDEDAKLLEAQTRIDRLRKEGGKDASCHQINGEPLTLLQEHSAVDF